MGSRYAIYELEKSEHKGKKKEGLIMPKLSQIYPKRQFLFSFTKVLGRGATLYVGFALGVRDLNLILLALIVEGVFQLVVDRLFFIAMSHEINGKT